MYDVSMLFTRHEAIAFRMGYRVDLHGRIRGLRGRILKGWWNNWGYHCFRVGHDIASVTVHRLVAYQKFGDKIYAEGVEVRHLDGNQRNNCPSNIDIGTASENCMDKPLGQRLRVAKLAALVVRKLRDEDVVALRADRAAGMKYVDLIKKYGVAKSTVSYVVNGKTYSEVAQSGRAGGC